MQCQILFSAKNKKNNINLSSAENAQRMVKVNMKILYLHSHSLIKAYIVHFIIESSVTVDNIDKQKGPDQIVLIRRLIGVFDVRVRQKGYFLM